YLGCALAWTRAPAPAPLGPGRRALAVLVVAGALAALLNGVWPEALAALRGERTGAAAARNTDYPRLWRDGRF
ncbi:hypothetical protein, partial [Janthinobacterium sp.]|uniref:hypothetical protein n=1 Tax=Janthinobacterium sp. TaxID=1871054 RepID=UPI00293D2DAA